MEKGPNMWGIFENFEYDHHPLGAQISRHGEGIIPQNFGGADAEEYRRGMAKISEKRGGQRVFEIA